MKSWLPLALLVFIGGCTMGPDYVRPPTFEPVAFRSAAADTAIVNLPWWEMFEDPILHDLIVDKYGKIVSNMVKSEKYSYKANLTAYAKAAQAVAMDMQVPFIDLHTLSIEHHNRHDDNHVFGVAQKIKRKLFGLTDLGFDWENGDFNVYPRLFYKEVSDYIQGTPTTNMTANQFSMMMSTMGILITYQDNDGD